MTIAFVHNGKAFLPEIAAYTEFFTARGIECKETDPEGLQWLQHDVAWHFMGTDLQKKQEGVFTIHEYTSASMPPAAGAKDIYKRFFNKKPDYRLFLNEYVRAVFSFEDDVPFGFRDMGLPASWLHTTPGNIDKEFDFIYVGEIRNREIHYLLDVFSQGALHGRSILIISRNYESIRRKYQAFDNIIFKGPLAHEQIRSYINKASFAINYMPDEEPFNRQTSTKLLEYAACGIPIITSDYHWMRNFEFQYGGRYFYLENDLSNFTWDAVQTFAYSFPDLSDWTWEKQIRNSGVLVLLEQQFRGLNLTAS